jgi:hypothetical protein
MSAHTVLHGMVDGYDVVTGFSVATVDPQSTALKVEALSVLVPEQAAVDALQKQIADRWARLTQDFCAMFGTSAVEITGPAQAQWFQTNKALAQADVDVYAERLVAPLAALRAARAKIQTENTVYFPLGDNEGILTDEQFAKLEAASQAIPEGADVQLLITGDTVADYRGITYWTSPANGKGKAWASRTISKLGDVPGKDEIEDGKLSDAQRGEIQAASEAARVAALSMDVKAKELAQVLSVLADQAVAMDAKAAIQGTDKTGTSWYHAEAAKAQAKYK